MGKVGRAHGGGWSGNRGVRPGMLKACGGQWSRVERTAVLRKEYGNYLGTRPYIRLNSQFSGAKTLSPSEFPMKVGAKFCVGESP